MPRIRNLFLAGLALQAVPAFAQSNDPNRDPRPQANTSGDTYVQLGVGFDYSEGKYGDVRDTRITSVPVSLKFASGNFTARISAPWVHVSGPGSLVSATEDTGGGGSSGRIDNRGPGSINSGGSSGRGGASSGDVIPGGASRKASGIGDTSVSLNYAFDLGDELYFDVTGKVKLPTASKAKRLGTGKADFTAAAALTKEFGGASIYAEGRRRFAGSSVASPVRDTWGFSTGLSGRIADGVRLGVDYDWQQSSFAGLKPSSEATGWVSFRVSQQFRVQLYASTGFNKNSVDAAGGISLTYRFYGL